MKSTHHSLFLSPVRLLTALAWITPSLAFSQTGGVKMNSWASAQADVLAWHALQPPPTPALPKPVLRVVYFHGNDMAPLADYAGRLSRIMRDVSDFYRDGLATYGIASPGLAMEHLPDGSLRLHLVKAAQPAAHYSYNSGDETEKEIRKALEPEFDLNKSFVLVLYGQCWKREDGSWGFYAPLLPCRRL
jgi:hypothetical protein